MDWSRAKSILISALLGLNIVLFAYILAYGSGGNISKDVIKNTEEVMKKRGVTLECEIPMYNNSMPALVLESYGLEDTEVFKKLTEQFDTTAKKILEGNEIIKEDRSITYNNKMTLIYMDSSPADRIDISSDENVEKYIRKFFSRHGFKMNSFELDRYIIIEPGIVKVSFIEKYKSFFIFSNFIEVTASKEGILEFRISKHKVKGQKGTSGEILPAHQILLRNFKNSEDMVITGIDIGYKSSDSWNEMKETREWATWRIFIKGGQEPLYFSANSGEEEKPY